MDMIIYHENCWDGFCAAWLATKAWPDIRLHPCNYGEDPPDVKGKSVIIADFSFQRPIMERLIDDSNRLVCLDHHKTAEEELSGLVDEAGDFKSGSEPEIIFDMEKSGGRLMWEYLFTRSLLPESFYRVYRFVNSAPWLVDYTEDRDLWRHKLANTKAVNAGIRSYPLGVGIWDEILEDYDRIVCEGAAILRKEAQIVSSHLRHAVPIIIDGVEGLVVNATVLISEIAGNLAEKATFGACWFAGEGKVVYSLRSRGEDAVDVSEIAKRFGGGGHKNAAGFSRDEEVEYVLESLGYRGENQ